jgi:hypothetical protein
MKCVWSVRYEEKVRRLGAKNCQWCDDTTEITVIANDDIRTVIRKTERHVIGKVRRWVEEGKKYVEKVVGVRIVGASLETTVDVR